MHHRCRRREARRLGRGFGGNGTDTNSKNEHCRAGNGTHPTPKVDGRHDDGNSAMSSVCKFDE